MSYGPALPEDSLSLSGPGEGQEDGSTAYNEMCYTGTNSAPGTSRLDSSVGVSHASETTSTQYQPSWLNHIVNPELARTW